VDLKLIPHKQCPECKARTIEDSCRSTHCNGQGFECRTFECGAVWKWSPNFERLENPTACPNKPEERLKKQKRLEAKTALKKFLKSLDVDESFKQHIWGGFYWMDPRDDSDLFHEEKRY
jgi:hypothetical protein